MLQRQVEHDAEFPLSDPSKIYGNSYISANIPHMKIVLRRGCSILQDIAVHSINIKFIMTVGITHGAKELLNEENSWWEGYPKHIEAQRHIQ